MASISTGFNDLAKESGSSGSSSFKSTLKSDFASALLCARGWPCRTNLEIEKDMVSGADFGTAL